MEKGAKREGDAERKTHFTNTDISLVLFFFLEIILLRIL